MGFFGALGQLLTDIFWALIPSKLRPQSLVGAARAGSDKAMGQVRFRRVAGVVRWIVHIALVLAVVALLFWINQVFDLERVLRSPWRPVNRVWLPLLFLLAYALGWLGWGLLRLLGQEPEAADFPDVARAWADAQRALTAAGVEATEAPLFLVLGRPARSVEDLFGAAQLILQVRNVPSDPDAPLHVYASRSGIFVTCEGASLLGRVHALLAPAAPKEAMEAGPPRELAEGTADEAPPGGPDGGAPTLTNGEAAHARTPVAVAAGVGAADAPESAEAEAPVAALLLEEEGDEAVQVRRNRLLLLRHAGDAERQTARLKFLCRLIARRRQPYCPVNGILVVLPYEATDNAADAAEVGELCREDLVAAREALHVHCPVQILVGDLEAAAGFPELVRRFDEGQRRQLLGRRFPLLPLFPDGEGSPAAMIDDGVRWLCLEMTPSLVYRLLRLEEPGGATQAEAVAENARLMQFAGEWRRRRPHLSRLLTRGLTTEPGEPALLGGCHLGATGPDASRGQAFVHDVFRLLIEDQNEVFWARPALSEDRYYRRLTWLAWGIAAVLVAAIGVFGWLLWLY
jgi:type VI protein secretion system component VasK